MSELNDKLPLLKAIAKGIALQFGRNCEVVVHDYSKPFEHSIVHIENGYITGRSVGDSGSEIGLRVLSGEEQEDGRYKYMTRTADGKLMRSSTIYIKDDQGKNIGSLCINYDISEIVVASKILQEFTDVKSVALLPGEQLSDNDSEVLPPTTYNEIDDMLTNMIEDSIKYVGVPVNHMTREQKKQGIKYLEKRGTFLIKKAGHRVAECYDISKGTVYNYLSESEHQSSTK